MCGVRRRRDPDFNLEHYRECQGVASGLTLSDLEFPGRRWFAAVAVVPAAILGRIVSSPLAPLSFLMRLVGLFSDHDSLVSTTSVSYQAAHSPGWIAILGAVFIPFRHSWVHRGGPIMIPFFVLGLDW